MSAAPLAPIKSPADFRLLLEETLYDARRFSDAYPDVYSYQSIVGVLDSLLRMTADLHRPTDVEKQLFETNVPLVRSQAVDVNPGLLQRFGAIWAYVIEWPVVRAKAQDSADEGPQALPIISALDELIAAVHRVVRDVKKSRIAAKEQTEAGSVIARETQEASRSIEKEMQAILAAIASSLQTSVVQLEFAARPDFVAGITQYIQHYLPEQADAIQQVRRSFEAWKKRPASPAAASEISSFDQFITAIQYSMEAGEFLLALSPEHEGLRSLMDALDRMRRQIVGWITDLELPDDRDTPILLVLSRDFDSSTDARLAGLCNNVKILSELLVNWSSASLGYFRQTLYETAIDLHVGQIISGTQGLDAVARGIQQLLYLTADGKEPKPYERREVELGEYYDRELRLYTSPMLPEFAPRLRAIDSYWRRWKAPRRKAKALVGDKPLTPPPIFPTRHEAERSAMLAVQQGTATWSPPDAHDEFHSGDYDPIAEAKGFTHEYFRHLLESSIRAIDVLPMQYSFSRALALELRAIRRATDRGRMPTADEQQAIGRGFAALARIIPGTESASALAAMKDAWAAHLHLQLLSPGAGDQPATQPAGMIADPEDFKVVINDLLSDAACLVVLLPNSDMWLDAYRQIERLNQRANYGRELTDAEKGEIDRALTRLTDPPGELFANVPNFAAGFVDRARQLFDYARGRRASSPAAFDELLRAVLAQTPEILNGRNWDEDVPRLAIIDRQLRAMRRWTAGGRTPEAIEREGTRSALSAVTKLRGVDRMTEWAARVTELTTAFCDDLPVGAGAPIAALAEITSVEAFGGLLDECMRDCKSLAGTGLFHKPAGAEIAWAEAAKQLAVVRRMLDQGRVPTRRERAEIHRVITGFDPAAPTPVETIHDFLPDIIERFSRVDTYYEWLVTAGPYAGKETGTVEEAGVQCVSLGGEMRVAFVRTGGTEPGIYVSRAEKVTTPQKAGDIDVDVMRYLPSTRDLLCLVPATGWTPAEIRWNAHSDWLAYLIPGQRAQVGWSQTREPGEKGRAAADAFAWATKGSNFIAIDLAGRSIFRINADNGQRKNLCALADNVALNIKPQIVVAPGGDCLVFTAGRIGGGVDLSFIEFAGAVPVIRLGKNFATATDVLPFWSRDGIACLVDHPGGSDIVSLPYTKGEGEILFQSPLTAARSAPAWSTTGKFIAFFNPQPQGDSQLVLYDCDTRALLPLVKPGALRGRLTFGEETLCVEGAEAATILWPHVSHKRSEAERF